MRPCRRSGAMHSIFHADVTSATSYRQLQKEKYVLQLDSCLQRTKFQLVIQAAAYLWMLSSGASCMIVAQSSSIRCAALWLNGPFLIVSSVSFSCLMSLAPNMRASPCSSLSGELYFTQRYARSARATGCQPEDIWRLRERLTAAFFVGDGVPD